MNLHAVSPRHDVIGLISPPLIRRGAPTIKGTHQFLPLGQIKPHNNTIPSVSSYGISSSHRATS